jgi:hypothetical protein
MSAVAGHGARATGPRAGGLPIKLAPPEIRRRARAEFLWGRVRDKSHDALLVQGMCIRCFGWVDDPRHVELVALPLSSLTARYAFRP